jgi:lipopolysaccharide biosynthesis regulator YciM
MAFNPALTLNPGMLPLHFLGNGISKNFTERRKAKEAGQVMEETKESLVRRKIKEGNRQLIAGNAEDAIDTYTDILNHDADYEQYLWQRGIAYYYAGRVTIFVQNFLIDLRCISIEYLILN